MESKDDQESAKKTEVECLARSEKNQAGEKPGGDHVRDEDVAGLLTALPNPFPFVPRHTPRPHVLASLAALYGHVMEVQPAEGEGMGMGHHQVWWWALDQPVEL